MSFVKTESFYNQGFFNQEQIREQMTNRRPITENGVINAIKTEYRNVRNTPEFNKKFPRNIPQELNIVSLNILNNNNLSEDEKRKINKLYALHGEKLFDKHKDLGQYNKTYQSLAHLPFEDIKEKHRIMNERIQNKKDNEDYYNSFQSTSIFTNSFIKRFLFAGQGQIYFLFCVRHVKYADQTKKIKLTIG